MFYIAQTLDSFGEKENDLPIKDGRLDYEANRSKCNDLPCLILFLGFVVAFAAMMVIGAINADFNRKTTPTNLDSETKPITFAGDLINRIWVLPVSVVVGIVICVAWILSMQVCAKICVWSCIFGSVGLVIITGAALAILSFAFKKTLGQSSTPILIVGIVVIFVGLCFLLAVFCCRTRIQLTIELIIEATKAVKAMPLLPCITSLTSILTLFLGGLTILTYALLIASCPYVTKTDGVRTWTEIEIPGYIKLFFFLVGVCYLWMQLFLIGTNQTVIGGAVSSWYFAKDKSQMPSSPIFASVGRTFRYHLGSVAFGSGIITLVEVLESLAESSANQARQGGNVAAMICCMCLQCILRMIIRLFRFITSRAYVYMAIKGTSFWPSAKGTGLLLIRNIPITVVLDKVLGLVMGLAEVLLFLVGAFCVVLMAAPHLFNFAKNPSTLAWVVILIVGVLLIMFTVHMIIDTYTFSVITIFMSYLFDEEMSITHQGRNDYETFASPDLQQHMRATCQHGMQMANEYKEKHPEFNMAYYAEAPGAPGPDPHQPGGQYGTPVGYQAAPPPASIQTTMAPQGFQPAPNQPYGTSLYGAPQNKY